MRNPFYFNINNTYLVKINYISQGDKFGRKKMALFNISASLSNVWLKRRETDTHLFLYLF